MVTQKLNEGSHQGFVKLIQNMWMYLKIILKSIGRQYVITYDISHISIVLISEATLETLKWQHVHQDVQLRRKAPLFEHQHQLLGSPKLL